MAGSASRRAGARELPGREDVLLVPAFAAGYVVLVVLGRLTVVQETGVSIVWPAAGLAVLWFVARARRPWPWLDVVVLTAATAGTLAATGAAPPGITLGTAANVLQTVVCCAVIAHGCPRIWTARGTEPLGRSELWWFLGAAAGSAIVSAPLIGLAVRLESGTWPWEVVLLWSARNAGAILLVGTLGLVLGAWLRRAREGLPRAEIGSSHPGERVVALLLTPVVYVLWFMVLGEVALVFPLLALTVWAGARLPSPLVTVHNAIVGTVVVALTAHGIGPFTHLGAAVAQVATAQLYVGLVCVLGLSLALDREDRERLVGDLGVARDGAQAQASLLSTIVETMTEGVRVVDGNGRLLVRNPAATRLLLGTGSAVAAREGADLEGISHLDGSPLSADELPYRRALAGEAVRELDLQVRTPGSTEARIVAFTTARLPGGAGGGVVTVLRDVTAERLELRRAAAVQAGLLPAHVPEVPGYELAARFVPAGSVGGDFYDWQRTPDGVVVTLADVMGKGPAAAILAASTRSVLQAHAQGADVAGTLGATEHALADDLQRAAAFVTAFRGHLDGPTGRLTYADAGHGLGFVVRADGTSRQLPALGPPLGVGLDEPRTAATVELHEGDVFLVFSDGVLDAAGGSLRDLRVHEQAIRGARTAREVADVVLRLATAAGPADDDLTVVVLRRQG